MHGCFILIIQRPPISTLCPYTTLFRSRVVAQELRRVVADLLELRERRQHDPLAPDALRRVEVPSRLLEHRGVERGLLPGQGRSEEHTSELQSRQYLVCRLLLENTKQSI